MTHERMVIATRRSELALWQSSFVRSLLQQRFPELEIDFQVIKTLGDKILDSPLSAIGDKGLFTKEIEQTLLDGTCDLAVHSLKDVPTHLPEGLTIGAVTKRMDPRDVFVPHTDSSFRTLKDLPEGSTVATGSLRRTCQILHHRPDLRIADVRGNLPTRLRKLKESSWGGMILAKAGLERLGLQDHIAETLPFDVMLPAVGQGALAIEIKVDHGRLKEIVSVLHDEETFMAVRGERALLRMLEGGCQVPIGTYGRLEGGMFVLEAMIGSLDGTRVVRGSLQGSPNRSEEIGIELAVMLLQQGGKEILEEIRRNPPPPRPPEQP
ncbi:MAG: hydroxymethylbilane synthase [Ignavibacteriales bacterium]|nr:hydroxymethylbilane synthase [Ignavibacteriales bacterium]